MPDPLITLTTDFGRRSPYAAAVRGVIASLCPSARVADLSHDLPAQDVAHASFFLAGAVPYWPAGTLHVAVVDPGVGGARAAIYVEARGQRFLAPDNGLLTGALDALGGPAVVRRVESARLGRGPVSATFHGRDVFAPAAGLLAAGGSVDLLGPAVRDWERLPTPPVVAGSGRVEGAVVFVDDFGNLITNIPAARLAPLGPGVGVRVGGTDIAGVRRTYSDAAAGEAFALVSSFGTLEIAVAHGDAARELGAGVGTRVVVAAVVV